jgi:hypothetical protein
VGVPNAVLVLNLAGLGQIALSRGRDRLPVDLLACVVELLLEVVIERRLRLEVTD